MTTLYYVPTPGDQTQAHVRLGNELRMRAWREGCLIYTDRTPDEIRNAFGMYPIPVDAEALPLVVQDPEVLEFIGAAETTKTVIAAPRGVNMFSDKIGIDLNARLTDAHKKKANSAPKRRAS